MNSQDFNRNNPGAEMFMAGAVVGAVLGAVIGMLISPNTGEENRRQVVKAAKRGREIAEDLYEEAEERASHLREDFEDYAHEAEKNLRPLKKQAEKYASHALDAAEDKIKETKKKYFTGVKM